MTEFSLMYSRYSDSSSATSGQGRNITLEGLLGYSWYIRTVERLSNTSRLINLKSLPKIKFRTDTRTDEWLSVKH